MEADCHSARSRVVVAVVLKGGHQHRCKEKKKFYFLGMLASVRAVEPSSTTLQRSSDNVGANGGREHPHQWQR